MNFLECVGAATVGFFLLVAFFWSIGKIKFYKETTVVKQEEE